MSILYDRSSGHDGTPSSYKAKSTPNLTFQQLKNGKIPVEKTIYLRGLSIDEAHKIITNLLASTHKQTLYLIIHGKGHRSEKQIPVLKSMLIDFLYRHPQVNAYCKATVRDGGSGALYLLATNRR